jgi:hypothetical protein
MKAYKTLTVDEQLEEFAQILIEIVMNDLQAEKEAKDIPAQHATTTAAVAAAAPPKSSGKNSAQVQARGARLRK